MVFDRLALVGVFDEVGATIHWSQRSFLSKKVVTPDQSPRKKSMESGAVVTWLAMYYVGAQ